MKCAYCFSPDVKEISASRAQSELKIREELDKLFAN